MQGANSLLSFTTISLDVGGGGGGKIETRVHLMVLCVWMGPHH